MLGCSRKHGKGWKNLLHPVGRCWVFVFRCLVALWLMLCPSFNTLVKAEGSPSQNKPPPHRSATNVSSKDKPKTPSQKAKKQVLKKKRRSLLRRYESELIEAALKVTCLKRDLEPYGKTVEKIVIVRENIVASIDPWPSWFNIIHAKTRESVIRQELLLREGQSWNQRKVEESERNLRSLSILATVRSLACLSKDPDKVIWLVVTKDVWSLKISTDFQLVGTVLRTLGLFPVETNFLGRNKQLGLEFGFSELDLNEFIVRNQWTIGQFYYDLRLAGTRLRLLEWFRIFLDGANFCAGAIGNTSDVWCPTTSPGGFRGIYAQLSLDRPLYSLSSKWGFAVGVELNIRETRVFRQNSPDQDPPPGERRGVSLSTVQLEHPDGRIRAVPRVYERNEVQIFGSLTRSFGYKTKHDFILGAGAYRFHYEVPSNFPFDDTTRRAFESEVLPRSESAAYVSLTYRLRPTEFRRFRNVSRYGLTEDFSMGANFQARISGALDLIRTSQQFLTFSASFSYRWIMGGNILTFATDGSARWQPRSNEVGLRGPWSNLQWTARLRETSPLLGIGRIHAQGYVVLRAWNIDRSFSTLGSEQGLRGYLNGQFMGENLFRVNIEYRTLPLVFWTLHVGMVVFYDGGAVWGGSDPNQPSQVLPFVFRQSVGLGLRILFPQFSKSMLRFDVGFPITDQPGPFANWLLLSFDQAF